MSLPPTCCRSLNGFHGHAGGHLIAKAPAWDHWNQIVCIEHIQKVFVQQNGCHRLSLHPTLPADTLLPRVARCLEAALLSELTNELFAFKSCAVNLMTRLLRVGKTPAHSPLALSLLSTNSGDPLTILSTGIFEHNTNPLWKGGQGSLALPALGKDFCFLGQTGPAVSERHTDCIPACAHLSLSHYCAWPRIRISATLILWGLRLQGRTVTAAAQTLLLCWPVRA